MTKEVEQLPLFEGHRPDTSEVRLTGSTAGQHQTYRIGQSVYFLVRGIVRGVTHEAKRNGAFIRSHKFEVLGAQQVDASGVVADRLVEQAAAYLATVNDEGQEPKSA